MRSLGLDIGTNSVGSAWIDTEKQTVTLGVSVFPAGVEETEEGRGAPKNQERRSKRSLRRSLARRSARKRALRKLLIKGGLLPVAGGELSEVFSWDPWELRRKGLEEQLTEIEFGRVLLHLCQRRGAFGLNLPEPVESADNESENPTKKRGKKGSDDGDQEGAVKEAVGTTKAMMASKSARTFGELIAILSVERRHPVCNADGSQRINSEGQPVTYSSAVRNQLGAFEFHADRALIRNEFTQLWETQAAFNGPLAAKLTPEFRLLLDDPTGDAKWRHKGALFGQRRTYWNVGTLGRCDLEPSDRCVPLADRHASYYRVLALVNNIRLQKPSDSEPLPLTESERSAVLAKLRSQKSGTIPAIRAALGIDKRTLKRKKFDVAEDAYKLNFAGGDDTELAGDWFHASIVAAIGEMTWDSWEEAQKERFNRAILRFDPQIDEDRARLKTFCEKVGLSAECAEQVAVGWIGRPKLEKRLNLSRRAIQNLLPYLEQADEKGHWRTQIEARLAFASDLAADKTEETPNEAAQRRHRIKRYKLGRSPLTKADRHYMKKHHWLPPAPTLSNPVVRKAIHEVRRHVIAHIRKHGGEIPDRIVIEFARETTKPKKESDRLLYRNLNRNKIRKKIVDEVIRPVYGDERFHLLSHNQLHAATDRVLLCMQQRMACAYTANKLDANNDHGPCAYSGRAITLRQAALGDGLQVDHIIPYSRCGDNSLNNRVLCYTAANQRKGQQTPREWWGDDFEDRLASMPFKQDHLPTRDDYFDKRDYATKWRNITAKAVKNDWTKSQLTDTAYASREVQKYLQDALWPDEPSHLEGGERRILVTKGRYTSILRRDWQLHQKLIRGNEASTETVQIAMAKNRGDHREHAIDAVAIALTDGSRIQELAKHVADIEVQRATATAQGLEPPRIKRNPILTPWGDVNSFRKQVLSQLYDSFDPVDAKDHDRPKVKRIVVSHRPVGNRLTGGFHEETLFSPVIESENLYTGTKAVSSITPKHLRLPRHETASEAIDRLTASYLAKSIESDPKKARKRAKAFVESKAYHPRTVDPPPEKSGLVRDIGMRYILRNQINKRLSELINPAVVRDADNFTNSDLTRILKVGPLTMPSGVPIKRVVLLRTMNSAPVIPRKTFDFSSNSWKYCKSISSPDDLKSRHPSDRVYVGGNNHHIEIRENPKGIWTGEVVTTFEASKRVRIAGLEAVNRDDDPSRGGSFVMSLAEGDVVHMLHKSKSYADFFVVFKLDKPQTIQFKPHWDARRATGEKDEQGNLIDNSTRESMPVSATELKSLAPPGEATPLKVRIDPLGASKRIEPFHPSPINLEAIDPRVMTIAREAWQLRLERNQEARTEDKKPQNGSWKWMRNRLKAERLDSMAAQLSAAFRSVSGND